MALNGELLIRRYKTIEELTTKDIEAFPVWSFANETEVLDDTLIEPVADIPVVDLANRIVGAKVRLSGGRIEWALLGNIDLESPEKTSHFLKISMFNERQWLPLSRYFDLDYQENGPQAFAARLGLKMEEVFPIVYDVRTYCVGDPDVLIGTIDAKPKRKLSANEIIALSVP